MRFTPCCAAVVCTLAAVVWGCADPKGTGVVAGEGAEISFERRGSGDPAIVFVHGWANDRTIWDAQVSHFSAAHDVVALDLPGFGESASSRGDWSMAAFGEDVAAVVRALELDPVVLVGFSMGAPVVIEAANRVPDRVAGVVIVDDLHDVEVRHPPAAAREMVDMLMNLIENPAPDKLTYFYRHDVEESYRRVLAMIDDGPRPGWRESLEAYIQWVNDESRGALERLAAPVVAINTNQEATDVEAFRKYVPSYEARIVPDVGHVVMWDATEEFNRLLEEIIRDFRGA